ncbi:hypothetical protein HGO34_06180 [Agrobacterium vitis]|uniref:Uncharacterized protein n=1 Tax=Agrobacterium vitis TaxID=373 RepID=A0AAE5AQZ9_AGRVI|nr:MULTISPECIES: hypothetical protein [Rhizobium/Agrobacterium group]MCF1499440.1 hypothetical protein [Allorhizobium sp. Av2]MBF2717546.1 hypothetical protein [Agrobacterium vitis]MCF1435730.1 hypothetical protein [Allorhizobium ampelinum]MCM2439308.1 hypothetical protein [Agrobacterium vitis]MUO27911.1 hypothetical protein [Agrobacterium vitis]
MEQAVLTASLTLTSAVIGGAVVAWLTHLLSSRREKYNKRRELIVKYLLETYDAIATPSFVSPQDEMQAIERAVDRVQVFGDPELLRLTKKYSDDLKVDGSSNTTELMKYVRSQIRRELGLTPTSEDFTILRFHELREKQ